MKMILIIIGALLFPNLFFVKDFFVKKQPLLPSALIDDLGDVISITADDEGGD